MTSRERVLRCLERNNPDRPPRHTWWLPIAELEHGADVVHPPAGGVIAQFEFGPACRLANAHAVHDEWNRIATAGLC